MMATLLLYAYCLGEVSSRAIERATCENVAIRFLAANQHPDHETIRDFRSGHLPALVRLFVEVLELCKILGFAQLGCVALNAKSSSASGPKHSAMSLQRMLLEPQRL
jgi:transposase